MCFAANLWKTPTLQTLPRQERLRGGERIGRLFAAGSRGATRTVIALILPSGDAETRVAFIAGKKLGCAVERNRMRRRLRAAYRMRKDALPAGYDVALMAKRGLLEARWRDVMNDVETAVSRAVGGGSCGRPPRGPGR